MRLFPPTREKDLWDNVVTDNREARLSSPASCHLGAAGDRGEAEQWVLSLTLCHLRSTSIAKRMCGLALFPLHKQRQCLRLHLDILVKQGPLSRRRQNSVRSKSAILKLTVLDLVDRGQHTLWEEEAGDDTGPRARFWSQMFEFTRQTCQTLNSKVSYVPSLYSSTSCL